MLLCEKNAFFVIQRKKKRGKRLMKEIDVIK